MATDKLSAIFENPDAHTRKIELSKLARSLNINMGKVKDEKGEIDENRLAILIFEELKDGKQKKQQHLFIIVMAIAFFLLSAAGVYALSRVLLTMSTSSSGSFFQQEKE
jgi:hypothetical protein